MVSELASSAPITVNWLRQMRLCFDCNPVRGRWSLYVYRCVPVCATRLHIQRPNILATEFIYAMHFLRLPQKKKHHFHTYNYHVLFVIEKQCVHCTVRMECLYIMQIKFGPQNVHSADTLFEYRVQAVVIKTSWFFSV